MPNLEDLFSPSLQNPVFQEVLELVKTNSKGKIWVIGGFVYRNLAAALYGGSAYDYDIDFIVEEKNEILKPARGWRIELNSYENPNYVRDTNKMSFTDIRKILRAAPMAAPTIPEYLKGVPLTIQAIVYDLAENRILGEKGIEALLTKTVAINYLPQAAFYEQRKKKPIQQIVEEKARELGFAAVL